MSANILHRNEIISYRVMCDHEGVQVLQKGMNFRLNPRWSVFLMSLRTNAPYRDRIEDGGRILIYEGHDVPGGKQTKAPKLVDQPDRTLLGKLTQNGKFYEAAQRFKSGNAVAEVVRVYQKLFDGVWAYNGTFLLVDSWKEKSGPRQVFKFRLELVDDQDFHALGEMELSHTRYIPSEIKLAVWKRDKGQCVKCGSKDNLHFDHDFPFSKGGASITEANVQLLCARHNLQKSDKIE